MRHSRMALVAVIAAGLVTLGAPQEAEASRIERACLQSERSAASRTLCGCIQRVADQMLTRADQRMAARFFTEPQMAQDVRMSDRERDAAFWKRYRAFGETAQKVCR